MTGIRVVVDKKGQLHFDYQGFTGSICYIEAQRVADMLKKMGIQLDDMEIKPKTVTGNVEDVNHEKNVQQG